MLFCCSLSSFLALKASNIKFCNFTYCFELALCVDFRAFWLFYQFSLLTSMKKVCLEGCMTLAGSAKRYSSLHTQKWLVMRIKNTRSSEWPEQIKLLVESLKKVNTLSEWLNRKQ